MVHETTQMTTILLRALLAVLLNISGWQIAYQRSWAMQLSVKTDTETEMVWRKKERTVIYRQNYSIYFNIFSTLRSCKWKSEGSDCLHIALKMEMAELTESSYCNGANSANSANGVKGIV